MRYVNFKCGPWSKEPHGILANILLKIFPKANPDFENTYTEVVNWWLEISDDNSISRELAFNALGEVVAAAPLGENLGIFTDQGTAPSELGQEISSSLFEEKWLYFEHKWLASQGVLYP